MLSELPLATPPSRAAAAGFSLDQVKELARYLATQPYDAGGGDLPAELKSLSYDKFRRINFRADHAIWRDAGLFRIELFHRGFYYDRKVTINLVEDGRVRELGYSPDLFDFRGLTFSTPFPPTLGFAGFRVHFPLNRPDYYDEFAVFLGASYFRLVGRGQQYGLSARGLAIDTGAPDGEEFPVFRQFWLVRPAADAQRLEVLALLDSKSTTGAYRISLLPGTVTQARVEAVLYPRRDIGKLGIAPLTSMYLHGKPLNRPFADLRPEVHDSDGLMLRGVTDERLWRPLTNPHALRISDFVDGNIKGFGLLQRDLDFASYEDPESRYDTRPSIWVVPEGEWGAGMVELVEIPTDEEINDNIVAYWVPKPAIKANEPCRYAYWLGAYLDTTTLSPGGRTIATRIGPAKPVDAAKEDALSPRLVWVDFGGGEIPMMQPEQRVEVKATASTGSITNIVGQKLGNTAWRAAFVFTPDGRKDAELRCFLALRGLPLTETWTYRWTAD
jgi:glucans biosynthesis protein